jgi:hypothetical protein
MTLENALHNFIDLLNKSTQKSEQKVYEKYIKTLTTLTNRIFSIEQLKSIESELDRLEVNTATIKTKRFYKNKFVELERFLKENFGLTPPLHYRKLYGGLGLSFGILFGIIFLASFERSIGIVFGMLIGMVIGSLLGISSDNKAIKEGKVI